MAKLSIADSCHKYGWAIAVIALIISTFINVVSVANYTGRIEQSLTDVLHRVDRLEKQQDEYLREIRGIK